MSRTTETWTVQKPDRLDVVEIRERKLRGQTELTYKANLYKNDLLLGLVEISGWSYNRFSDGHKIHINEKNFVNPHPWKGREDVFLPNKSGLVKASR